ncbi:MAG: DUF998 domain-containing protein, partial [Thermoplasmata archaeon]|nr:DUF998 domain-containing protein [Thermoplasmata archaeon]
VGPYGIIMTVNFLNRGVLSLVFLYVLFRGVEAEGRGWDSIRSGVAFLSLWAVGALILSAFPTDVPSLPLSGHGTVHLVVALLAFFGGAVGVFALADHFEKSERLRRAKRFAFPFAIVVVLLFVVELTAGFALPTIAAQYGGLVERVFLGSVLAWILAVSLFLTRTMPRPPRSSFTPTRLGALEDPDRVRGGTRRRARPIRSAHAANSLGLLPHGSDRQR